MYRDRRDVLKMFVSASVTSMAHGAGMRSAFTVTSHFDVLAEMKRKTRERISQGLARGESTGIAVAVVDGDHIIWEEGFGWADREAQVGITPHSSFNLESVTKPFTTTLITTFAAEGKLDLDQPANRFLGGGKIRGSNGDPDKATIRRLGAHCSGLPGIFEALYDGVQSPPADVFLEKFGRLAFPPGEIWEYSNVAFEALGGIAWNLTETDFGELMDKRVLGPLGMKDSFWDTNAARVARAVPRYGQAGKRLPFHLSTTPPSGELLSSAHDLARFAMWNMKQPSRDGSRLLNEHWIDELHKPVFVSRTGAASTFGWARDRLSSGETVIHKGGGGPGASTMICFVPERKLACVVLNNHHSQWFTDAVCDRIMKSYFPAWKTLNENGEPPRTRFTMSDVLGGVWKGTLMNDGLAIPAELKITSDDVATLALGSGLPLQLNHLQLEGRAFLAEAVGTIHSPESTTVAAHALRLKVVPFDGRLVGRVNAVDLTPDHEGGIPYVLTLRKVASSST